MCRSRPMAGSEMLTIVRPIVVMKYDTRLHRWSRCERKRRQARRGAKAGQSGTCTSGLANRQKQDHGAFAPERGRPREHAVVPATFGATARFPRGLSSGASRSLLLRLKQPIATATKPAHLQAINSGGGIRTRDLRVMSPTSYQTAPPRGVPTRYQVRNIPAPSATAATGARAAALQGRLHGAGPAGDNAGMATVFVTRALPGNALARLRDAHQVTVWDGALPPPPEALRAALADTEGLLCLLTERVDAALLDAAPRLRAIANYAVGTDNIDLELTAGRGIAVGVTPDVLTEATADLAFALMLAAARRLPEAQAAARAGRWRTWEPAGWLGTDVDGAELGIVGFGRIGRAVARRAEGFRMSVRSTADTPLPELLATSDFVSLHCPLTPATRHLIDAGALALMRAERDPRQHRARRSGRSASPDRGARARADRGRRHRRDRSGAAATRRPHLLDTEPDRRAPHRLGHGLGSRAHDRARGGEPARRPRRAADAAPGSLMRVAVVDIGTNSTRLLIADVDERRSRPGARAAHARHAAGRRRRCDRPPRGGRDRARLRHARGLPRADRGARRNRAPGGPDERRARRHQRRRVHGCRARALRPRRADHRRRSRRLS